MEAGKIVNHALVQKANINLKQMLDFCHQLLLSSTSPSANPTGNNASNTGKALLSQYRQLGLYYSAYYFHPEWCIDVPFFYALVLKLKTLSASDNDNDRKIFRIVLFLVVDSFIYYSNHLLLNEEAAGAGAGASSSEGRTLLLAVKELVLFLHQEINYQTSGSSSGGVQFLLQPKKLVLVRVFGHLLPFLRRNARVRSLLSREASAPALTKQVEEITRFLCDGCNDAIVFALAAGKGPSGVGKDSDKRALLHSLFSALRRSRGVLQTKDIVTLPLLSLVTRWKAVAILRNVFEVIRHSLTCLRLRERTFPNTSQLNDYVNYFGEMFVGLLKGVGETRALFADVFSVRIFFEVVREVVLHFLVPLIKRGTGPHQAFVLPSLVSELLLGILGLVGSESVRFVTEAVSLFCLPELAWHVIPCIEGDGQGQGQAGMVRLLCTALTNHIKALPVDDVAMPVLLRGCEKMGRLLQSRPHFGDHRVHPSHHEFSPERIQSDGEAIIPLWLALRRHYRLSNTAKEKFVGLPTLVKTIARTRNLDLAAVEARSYWGYDAVSMSNVTRVSQSIPNAFAYVSLLKACISLAPDVRYCPREHDELWRGFALSLYASVEALASQHTSCEYLLGDTSELITDVLTALHARVRASTFLSYHPNTSSSKKEVSQSLESLLDSAAATSALTQRKIVPVLPNLHYLAMLCDVSTLTVRYALTHRLVHTVPSIWQTLLLIVQKSEDADVALSAMRITSSHLFAVLTLSRGANRFQNESRAQMIAGLRQTVLPYLTRLIALLIERAQNLSKPKTALAPPARSSFTLDRSLAQAHAQVDLLGTSSMSEVVQGEDKRWGEVVEEVVEEVSHHLSELYLEFDGSSDVFSSQQFLLHLLSLCLLILEKNLFSDDVSPNTTTSTSVRHLLVLQNTLQTVMTSYSASTVRRTAGGDVASAPIITPETIATSVQAFLNELHRADDSFKASHILLLTLQQVLSLLTPSNSTSKVSRDFLLAGDVMLFGPWNDVINQHYVEFIDISVRGHLPIFHNPAYQQPLATSFSTSFPSSTTTHQSSGGRGEGTGFDLGFDLLTAAPNKEKPPSMTSVSFSNELSVFDQSDVLLMPSSNNTPTPSTTSNNVRNSFPFATSAMNDDFSTRSHVSATPSTSTSIAAVFDDSFTAGFGADVTPSFSNQKADDLFPTTSTSAPSWKTKSEPFSDWPSTNSFISTPPPQSSAKVDPFFATSDFATTASFPPPTNTSTSQWGNSASTFNTPAVDPFAPVSSAPFPVTSVKGSGFSDFDSDFASKPTDFFPPTTNSSSTSQAYNPFDSLL